MGKVVSSILPSIFRILGSTRQLDFVGSLKVLKYNFIVSPARSLNIRFRISMTTLALVFGFSFAGPALAKKKLKQSEARNLKVTYKQIKSGDTLSSILRQHSFDNNQIAKILRDKSFHEPFTLIPKEEFRISQGRKGRFLELKFYERPTDNVFVFWRDGERSGHHLKAENYEVKVRTATGVVNGSILASLKNHVSDDWVAQRFMDAYALDFKLTRVLKRGAKFSVTYEEKFDDGHFVGCGEVLETSLEINGEMKLRKFVNFKNGGSFIANDWIHKSRPFYSPVNYLRITSSYNPRRLHPITRRRQPHLGVDFELPKGDPIYTAYAGRVLRMGKNRAAGRYIVIRHPNGLESYYNHLHKIHPDIKKGKYVANGQVIGEIGCTGYCTKPHLHFAVKQNGRFINPVPKMKSYPFVEKKLISRQIASNKKSQKVVK
ncbi:MAG: M23 family metallopeptidase [Bdellovibrionales bacterium]|nr:M23 family metallopeptidase [Bdellovibrionales bacterium]